MAQQGSKYMEQWAGGFTPEQHGRIEKWLEQLRRWQGERRRAGGRRRPALKAGSPGAATLVALATRDVVGENKQNPVISF